MSRTSPSNIDERGLLSKPGEKRNQPLTGASFGRQKGTHLMSVFVVDRNKRPLMPCSEKRARILLGAGIESAGRGSHCRTNVDGSGFPRGYLTREKRIRGFSTGDLVRAVVPAPLKTAGVHTGRVAVRASGSFRVGKVDGINARYCVLLQRTDGYTYSQAVVDRSRPDPCFEQGTPASSLSFKSGASAGGTR